MLLLIHALTSRWFSETAVEVRAWMKNYLPHETANAITYLYLNERYTMLVKDPNVIDKAKGFILK